MTSGTRWQPYPPALLLTEACRFESHSPAKASSPASSPLLNQGYSTFFQHRSSLRFFRTLDQGLGRFLFVSPSIRHPSIHLLLDACLAVSHCAQFVEPRVGAAPAGRLDEDSRSHGDCRHGGAPLAGPAAVAGDTLWSPLSCLVWRTQL